MKSRLTTLSNYEGWRLVPTILALCFVFVASLIRALCRPSGCQQKRGAISCPRGVGEGVRGKMRWISRGRGRIEMPEDGRFETNCWEGIKKGRGNTKWIPGGCWLRGGDLAPKQLFLAGDTPPPFGSKFSQNYGTSPPFHPLLLTAPRRSPLFFPPISIVFHSSGTESVPTF